MRNAIAKITALKQQLAKEMQHTQMHIDAQIMVCDSKVKARYEKQG
jgi:hypothetical protein